MRLWTGLLIITEHVWHAAQHLQEGSRLTNNTVGFMRTIIYRCKGFSHAKKERIATVCQLMFYLIFLCQYKSSDEIEMIGIVVKFCFYSSSIFS